MYGNLITSDDTVVDLLSGYCFWVNTIDGANYIFGRGSLKDRRNYYLRIKADATGRYFQAFSREINGGKMKKGMDRVEVEMIVGSRTTLLKEFSTSFIVIYFSFSAA